jgi:hypothetical protein
MKFETITEQEEAISKEIVKAAFKVYSGLALVKKMVRQL